LENAQHRQKSGEKGELTPTQKERKPMSWIGLRASGKEKPKPKGNESFVKVSHKRHWGKTRGGKKEKK